MSIRTGIPEKQHEGSGRVILVGGHMQVMRHEADEIKPPRDDVLAGESSFEFREIDFFHAQHGMHRPLCFRGSMVGKHLGESHRNDLPRKPELVLQPTTLLRFFISASREFSPVVIYFLLRVAENLERNGLCKFEKGTAVQRREGMTVEHEVDHHHGPRRSAVDFFSLFAVTDDSHDLRIFEDLRIIFCRRFGLIVEPQTRREFSIRFHDDFWSVIL